MRHVLELPTNLLITKSLTSYNILKNFSLVLCQLIHLHVIVICTSSDQFSLFLNTGTFLDH